ncbi:GNAT family N-acetyltransferase [Solwaraspora sp. WMMB335]|uniref:GNAT family N-acetyltransferase n=1 Tax=Solwaraspora sp. WMMB335 TaxID=3404118 RepID=UPI003B93E648
MLVRREQADDVGAVRGVVAAAFARTGTPDEAPVEVALLDRLRADGSWLAELSLVALVEPGSGHPAGGIVGHVVCTRAYLGDDRPVLGLGPLAVRPDRQRTGVGTALMHAVLGAAEALDEPLVALLGSPAFYRRFGFRAAAEFGIIAPDPQWGRHFQVRLLGPDPAPYGRFRYATPFDDL